ncbi:MAG TPA: aspartyl protease family protein [Chthonomonadaceae bacterium]|nr:aspartyl protease family protein [Chthonomonadaceae bacterium]
MKTFPIGTLFLLLGFLCLSATAAGAQTGPQAAPEALLERAIAAHGGREGLEKARAHLTVEGDITVYKPFANTLHILMRRTPDRLRMDFRSGGLEGTYCLGPTGGWKQALGIVSSLSQEELEGQRLSQEHNAGLLLKVQSAGYKLISLGRKKLPDGFVAEAVRATPPDKGEPTDFYFDPETGLLAGLGLTGRNVLRGVDEAYLYRMRDYRPQDGIPISFQMQTYADGALTQELKVTRADLASDIPDSVFARPDAASANATSAAEPFDFSTGEVVVRASINGKPPRKFMVDTGAGITMLMPDVAKELGLALGAKLNLGAGGGAAAGRVTRVASIQVGSARVKDVNVVVSDISSFRALIGADLAGILGYNFLSQFQVTLDYGAQRLTLAPASAPLPSGDPAGLDIGPNVPIVEARIGGQKCRMMLDTGAMWTILPPRLASCLRLGPTRSDTYALGMDGHAVALRTTRLPALSAAGQMARGVIVSFAPPSGSTGALLSDSALGILGNSFLRRFRVTLDYGKQKAVLTPLPAGDPYPDEWTHPGLILAALAPNTRPVVAAIYPGSPASRSRLRLLDTVIAINGKPIRGLNNYALARALCGPANSRVRITVLRRGKPRTYTLKRVRLL